MQTLRQPDASRGHGANYWYEVRMRGAQLDNLRRVLLQEHHPVEKVKRIAFGPFTLEGIPRGRYRLLSESDVNALLNAPARPSQPARKKTRRPQKPRPPKPRPEAPRHPSPRPQSPRHPSARPHGHRHSSHRPQKPRR